MQSSHVLHVQYWKVYFVVTDLQQVVCTVGMINNSKGTPVPKQEIITQMTAVCLASCFTAVLLQYIDIVCACVRMCLCLAHAHRQQCFVPYSWTGQQR